MERIKFNPKVLTIGNLIQRATYNVFLDVLLVHCLDAVLQQLWLLDVADAIVKVGLEAPHHRLDLVCLRMIIQICADL